MKITEIDTPLSNIKKMNELLPNFLNVLREVDSAVSYNDVISARDFLRPRVPKELKKYYENASLSDCLFLSLYQKYFYKYSDRGIEHVYSLFQFAIALYEWNKYKKIYVIDKALAEFMLEEAKSDEIYDMPITPLLNIPYPSIYIKCDIFGMDSSKFNYHPSGMIARLEFKNFNRNGSYDELKKDYKFSISLSYCIADGSRSNVGSEYNLSLPIYGDTLRDAVNYLRRSMHTGLSHIFINRYDVYLAAYIILYLVASNADIQRRETIYKSLSNKDLNSLNQVETFDVGINVGKAISLMKDNSKDKDSNKVDIKIVQHKKYKQRKAHVRCAHWHRYWVGPRDDPSARKLIVKWIPPIFVNLNKNQEIKSISVTPVKI